MIYLKENPIGIDAKIQSIQKHIEQKIVSFDLDIYGRAEVKDSLPLVFHKRNDYRNALVFSDKINGKVFFVDSSSTNVFAQATTDLDIIFLLDLVKLKPNIPHRADEEIKVEIYNILQRKFSKSEITITKGVDALNGFETNLKDFQPYHFLKFSLKVNYNLNDKC